MAIIEDELKKLEASLVSIQDRLQKDEYSFVDFYSILDDLEGSDYKNSFGQINNLIDQGIEVCWQEDRDKFKELKELHQLLIVRAKQKLADSLSEPRAILILEIQRIHEALLQSLGKDEKVGAYYKEIKTVSSDLIRVLGEKYDDLCKALIEVKSILGFEQIVEKHKKECLNLIAAKESLFQTDLPLNQRISNFFTNLRNILIKFFDACMKLIDPKRPDSELKKEIKSGVSGHYSLFTESLGKVDTKPKPSTDSEPSSTP